MWHYNWIGIDTEGRIQSGQISALTLAEAKKSLHQQGIITRTITPKRRIHFKPRARIRPNERILCLQQLAQGLSNGVPILMIVETMIIHQANRHLKHRLKQIQSDLSRGLSLSEALGQHPDCFHPLLCHGVMAGEQSGTLPAMLRHLAATLTTHYQFKKRLQKALAYPLTVMGVAGMVVWCLLVFVVPQFESFYQYFAAEMPWPTQCLIGLSQHLRQYLGLLLGLFVFAFMGLRATYRHNSAHAKRLEWLLFKIPLLGTLLQHIALTRLTHALSAMYTGGLSLIESIHTARFVAGYVLYIEGLMRIHQHLMRGESLQRALQENTLFSPFVVQRLNLGEETGTLQDALAQIALYYQEDIEQRMQTFTAIFEPLLMALLGIGMGALIVALYLPILNLGSLV